MIEPLIAQLKKHKKIGTISHVRPDGDALGSQIALCLWLEKVGIEAVAFNDDPMPSNMMWMADFFPLTVPGQSSINTCDAFIFVDGNNARRFGEFGQHIMDTKKPVYLVDHHPGPQGNFTLPYSVPSASSTAELVYRFYAESDLNLLDEKAAKAMYAGIVTDTGSFRFDSVSPELHEITAELLRRGKFNPSEIHQLIYDNRRQEQLNLLGMTLKSIKTHINGRVGTVVITDQMLRETKCVYSDIDGFVSYPLSIKGVEASVLFCEKDERVKLSFRSKSDLDVNKWANEFGGGGHQKAAGAWHNGPINVAVHEVMTVGRRLMKQLR